MLPVKLCQMNVFSEFGMEHQRFSRCGFDGVMPSRKQPEQSVQQATGTQRTFRDLRALLDLRVDPDRVHQPPADDDHRELERALTWSRWSAT